MASQRHFALLKQGVEVWNQWRREHPYVRPPDFTVDDAIRVRNYRCDTAGANLIGANLSGLKLVGIDLSFVNLIGASLIGTDLSKANLYNAYLGEANLSESNLCEADLRLADLTRANLSRSDLGGADLSQVSMQFTVLGDVDLSTTKGLDSIFPDGPSIIDINTMYRSHGKIPEIFLRRAGVPSTMLDFMRSMLIQSIDYFTCFISYSGHDEAFVKRLYVNLQDHGVRCWFAPVDLKIGDHYHQRIDESIRLYDKLILVLSEHAIQSTWVEREVMAAREKEDREQHPVLFPLRLDDAVMHTTKAWAADIRRRWHIGDFTRWKQHDDYQRAFDRLLRDLKAESEKDGQSEREKSDGEPRAS